MSSNPGNNFDIILQVNEAQRQDVEQTLAAVKNGAVKAQVAALNRTLSTGSTRIRRFVAQANKMNVGAVGKSVRPVKANYRNLTGAIRLLNYNVPIGHTRQPLKPGLLAVRKIGPMVSVANTPFTVATVFARYGAKRVMTKGRYAGKVREPIAKIYVESPRKDWESRPGDAQNVLKGIGDVLQKNLSSQIDRLLNRQKPTDE